MDYNMIFSMHVARLLEESGMKKQELAEKAGVSSTVITDLTRAKSNPTIKTMQKIAEVFSIPLPMMLKPYESYEWQAWIELWGTGNARTGSAKLPRGYRSLDHVVLPTHKIAIVKEWMALDAEQRESPKTANPQDEESDAN
ncbi:helix-turn-helix domain-containing protein [Bilophila wadsworthia]|uniref:helix-turn-helix domain-containing protein n=1 Tax=Bilophila wadsworthia TaxID=35833 RepID=UPI001D0A6C6C|nr:helix-turn-helix domain-containing protein [Bilophila wadsworthia]MCB8573027.1 helix-turn-helix domain-containing protein [Bilophila wadsworthia]